MFVLVKYEVGLSIATTGVYIDRRMKQRVDGYIDLKLFILIASLFLLVVRIVLKVWFVFGVVWLYGSSLSCKQWLHLKFNVVNFGL